MPVTAAHHPLRTAAVVAGVLLLLVVAVLAVLYRDQIRRYVTHTKGSPTSTEAWAPFPEADGRPDLHLVAVGDIGDSGARLGSTGAAVAELDERQRVDGLFLLGDNVYPAGPIPTTSSLPRLPS